MKLETLKKYRDVLKGKTRLTVTGDNSELFTDGNEGTAVLWNDDQEVLIAVRPNIGVTQAQHPYSVTICDYESIQYLDAYIDATLLKELLDATGHKNASKAYEMLTKSDVSKANTTLPTSSSREGLVGSFQDTFKEPERNIDNTKSESDSEEESTDEKKDQDTSKEDTTKDSETENP